MGVVNKKLNCPTNIYFFVTTKLCYSAANTVNVMCLFFGMTSFDIINELAVPVGSKLQLRINCQKCLSISTQNLHLPGMLLFRMVPIFSLIFCTVGRKSLFIASGANLSIPCEDHVTSLSPYRFIAVSMEVS